MELASETWPALCALAAIASRIMTGAVGLMSLTVALLILVNLSYPDLAIASFGASGWAGAAIIAAAGAAFAIAMLVSRRTGRESASIDPPTTARLPQHISSARFSAPHEDQPRAV